MPKSRKLKSRYRTKRRSRKVSRRRKSIRRSLKITRGRKNIQRSSKVRRKRQDGMFGVFTKFVPRDFATGTLGVDYNYNEYINERDGLNRLRTHVINRLNQIVKPNHKWKDEDIDIIISNIKTNYPTENLDTDFFKNYIKKHSFTYKNILKGKSESEQIDILRGIYTSYIEPYYHEYIITKLKANPDILITEELLAELIEQERDDQINELHKMLEAPKKSRRGDSFDIPPSPPMETEISLKKLGKEAIYISRKHKIKEELIQSEDELIKLNDKINSTIDKYGDDSEIVFKLLQQYRNLQAKIRQLKSQL